MPFLSRIPSAAAARTSLVAALCVAWSAAVAAPALSAEFQYPLAVAAAEDGTVYVADRNLPGLWTISNGEAELYFEGSKRFRTPLNAVRCVAVDREGRVVAGDSATREVFRFDAAGQPQPLTSRDPDAEPFFGEIGIPMAIAVAEDGALFVADLELHRIWKVPADGGEPAEFAVVPAPRGLAIDGDGRLWVVSHGKDQVVHVSPDGEVKPFVSGRPFSFPHNIVLGPDGVSYVSDGYEKAIWKIDAEGNAEKWISGEPLINPVGIARRGDALLIADPHAKTIFEADADGKLTPLAGEAVAASEK